METIKVYNAYIRRGEFFFGVIGEVKHNGNVTEEDIWDLTNWSCWLEHEQHDLVKDSGVSRGDVEYYPNDNDRGFTNDDIAFFLNGKWWVAESCGWKTFDSFREASTFLINNAEWVRHKLDDLK